MVTVPRWTSNAMGLFIPILAPLVSVETRKSGVLLLPYVTNAAVVSRSTNPAQAAPTSPLPQADIKDQHFGPRARPPPILTLSKGMGNNTPWDRTPLGVLGAATLCLAPSTNGPHRCYVRTRPIRTLWWMRLYYSLADLVISLCVCLPSTLASKVAQLLLHSPHL